MLCYQNLEGQIKRTEALVLITVVLSSVVELVSYLIVKYTVGLRVPAEAEREGLDITSHGESAYEA